jgi:1-phosphatidylinositol-4-phosphate 5-kinase
MVIPLTNWRNGLANGKDFCKYASGACYIGTWDRGLKDGQGIFYPPGSKIYCNLEVSESITDQDVASASGSSNENVNNGLSFVLQRLCNMWKLCSLFHWSRCISNGTTPVLDDNSGNHLSQDASTEPLSTVSLQDSGDDKVLVDEREYVQGVLIHEMPKDYDSGMLHSGKTLDNTWQTEAGGPMETIYKGHRRYYLMLNLQLGIR